MAPQFILKVELCYTVTGCCNVRCLIYAWFVFILQKNVFTSRSVRQTTKEKSRKTNPSSSVDPGTFVFYQQVFPLKRFHDCFPCNNNKLSFITVVNVLFKEMNGTAYGLNQVNHSGAYASGRRRVTLEDQEGWAEASWNPPSPPTNKCSQFLSPRIESSFTLFRNHQNVHARVHTFFAPPLLFVFTFNSVRPLTWILYPSFKLLRTSTVLWLTWIL